MTVREQGGSGNTVVIIDMSNPLNPTRRQISADSALMCWDKKVIALKATAAGVPGDNLQVFNLDTKTKLKAYQMPEAVEFWKWISPSMLGLITATSVYHWDIEVRAPRWQQLRRRGCSSPSSPSGRGAAPAAAPGAPARIAPRANPIAARPGSRRVRRTLPPRCSTARPTSRARKSSATAPAPTSSGPCSSASRRERPRGEEGGVGGA